MINNIKTVISKHDGEYQVRLYINGRCKKDATYYTNDKADAEQTANDMAKRENESQKNLK